MIILFIRPYHVTRTVQYTGHVKQMETRDNDNALPLV